MRYAVTKCLAGAADAIRSIEPARFHHAHRRRGGLAARGARAARRADAADRRAHVHGRRQRGLASPTRGIPARATGIRLGGRPQFADRHPLGHRRSQPPSSVCCRVGIARARRNPGHWLRERGAVTADHPHRPYRVRDRSRSGRRRPHRQPGATRRQRYRLSLVRIRPERQMAGVAQADRAGRDASGNHSMPMFPAESASSQPSPPRRRRSG
jgi:hypothetical protein